MNDKRVRLVRGNFLLLCRLVYQLFKISVKGKSWTRVVYSLDDDETLFGECIQADLGNKTFNVIERNLLLNRR